MRGEDLRKSFGRGPAAFEAVRGVDISIAPGEITALVGPSGSGKSTLLHLLSGLDTPTAGTVWFRNVELARLSPADRARLRATAMGFVLQRDNLIPALTIEENVAAPLMLAGWSRPAALERARHMLSLVGLAERRGAWPATVSGGEGQRTALARACAGDPAVIYADEPTGALDSAAGRVVLDLLRSLTARTGAAVLVVTHDSEVAATADRVVAMRDGALDVAS